MSEEGLKVSVLASGSTGNVTYIETPERKVLIDAGLSGKKIAGLMESVGRDISEVDSMFVTHEHSDHIQSVGVLARKYGIDIYANRGTWDAIGSKVGKIPTEQKFIFDPNTTKSLDDLDIESFSVSHDAAEPQFYEFHHDGKSFVILTDTGYVSDQVAGTIRNADGYLFEANHDTEMLRMGGYPWHLKQRIMGDHGHLSNEDGADALMDVIGNRTKKIYLGHLSLHNNMKELAHLTVSSIMQNHDLAVGHDFQILDTDHEKADPLTLI